MNDAELLERADALLFNIEEPIPFETESLIFECIGALSMEKDIARETLKQILEEMEEK